MCASNEIVYKSNLFKGTGKTEIVQNTGTRGYQSVNRGFLFFTEKSTCKQWQKKFKSPQKKNIRHIETEKSISNTFFCFVHFTPCKIRHEFMIIIPHGK